MWPPRRPSCAKPGASGCPSSPARPPHAPAAARSQASAALPLYRRRGTVAAATVVQVLQNGHQKQLPRYTAVICASSPVNRVHLLQQQEVLAHGGACRSVCCRGDVLQAARPGERRGRVGRQVCWGAVQQGHHGLLRCLPGLCGPCGGSHIVTLSIGLRLMPRQELLAGCMALRSKPLQALRLRQQKHACSSPGRRG